MVTTLYATTITIANVSLPQIQGALSASPDQVAWVVTSNLIATAVTIPLAGWIAARAITNGARYLRGRGPLHLALQERIGDRSTALKLEARVKKLPRPQKEALLSQGHIPDRLRSPGDTPGI